MYILHVLSIKLRYKLYFSFSIPTPGFPHFYYMLGANLGLLSFGEVSVMKNHLLRSLKGDGTETLQKCSEHSPLQKLRFLLPLLMSHRLIMRKVKISLYFYLTADILTKVLQKYSLSSPLSDI